MSRQIRQGDVLLLDEPIPASTVRKLEDGPIILSYGEATGHAHTILDTSKVEEWTTTSESVDRWLCVRSQVAVVHPEHAPVTLDPGDYRIVQQREYAPQAIRRVSD